MRYTILEWKCFEMGEVRKRGTDLVRHTNTVSSLMVPFTLPDPYTSSNANPRGTSDEDSSASYRLCIAANRLMIKNVHVHL